VTGDEQEAPWPLPKFHFTVDIDGVGTDLPFQEVSGLSVETQVVEYRGDNSKAFSTVKMPGVTTSGSVTLKKGIFAKDDKFFEWHARIKRNAVERATVTIKLLDERGAPTMVWTLWTLTNAWPRKITGTDLKAEGNEVAVETLELAHEGLTIANA
jgi:phage tail-like protein